MEYQLPTSLLLKSRGRKQQGNRFVYNKYPPEFSVTASNLCFVQTNADRDFNIKQISQIRTTLYDPSLNLAAHSAAHWEIKMAYTRIAEKLRPLTMFRWFSRVPCGPTVTLTEISLINAGDLNMII